MMLNYVINPYQERIMEILEREFGKANLSLETGRLARQANGSVLVRYGDTMVLVAACLLYTSPSPRDVEESRMPSSA